MLLINEHLNNSQLHTLVANTFLHHNVKYDNKSAESMVKIIKMESDGNTRETIKTSSSRGLTGFLRREEKEYHITWESPLEDQIWAMYKYIVKRYKTPVRAYKFHLKKGWY